MNTLKHIAALLVVTLIGGDIATAEVPGRPCVVELSVELTPDVPNPRDPGFLSSLLSNQPGYHLTLRRVSSETVIVVDLSGLGPADRCQNVIETMRKDGRVLAVNEPGVP
jgi:hypothetical protein